MVNTQAQGTSPVGVLAAQSEGRLRVHCAGVSFSADASAFPTVGELALGMSRNALEVLHVHPSALPLLGLPGRLEVPRPGERRAAHPWMAGRPLAPSIELADGGQTRTVMIGAYQDGAGDPFACEDPTLQLEALLTFERAFATAAHPRGWAYRQSIATTGWNLMHAAWRTGRRRARLAELMDEANPRPEDVGAGQVEIPNGSKWHRRAEDRAGLPWVVAWDVNGQRLAACARLELGVGGLVRRRYVGTGIIGREPGYHYVTHISQPFPGQIPLALEPGWHTTPRVRMAEHLGLELAVRESWVWERQVPYLDPFYERMRDARQQLLAAGTPAAAIALRALKQCYLQPLGRLRSRRAREAGDVLYRPDWYDAVIGQELAREYYKLHQLATGTWQVLAVYFDAIICEVRAPEQVPDPIEVSGQLGKYKPIGVLAGDEAREILDSQGVGALAKALKAAGSPTASAEPAALSAFARPTHGGYPG